MTLKVAHSLGTTNVSSANNIIASKCLIGILVSSVGFSFHQYTHFEEINKNINNITRNVYNWISQYSINGILYFCFTNIVPFLGFVCFLNLLTTNDDKAGTNNCTLECDRPWNNIFQYTRDLHKPGFNLWYLNDSVYEVPIYFILYSNVYL